jgi:hypothetical protein
VAVGLFYLEMGIDGQLCARKAAAIKEAGVDGAVSDYKILGSGKGAENSEVCLIASREE